MPATATLANAQKLSAPTAGEIALLTEGFPDGITSILASAADVFAGAALRRPWSRATAQSLFERVALMAQMSPEEAGAGVYSRAARDPRLLTLPFSQAIRAELGLLYGVAPVSEVSFWCASEAKSARCLFSFGTAPTRHVRSRVREALHDRAVPAGAARAIYALPIPNQTAAGAALAFRVEPGRGRRALELAGEALPALAWLLERDHVLEIGEETQQTLAEALLREARIACELHDNSLQDVAALATELRYFRQQLVQALLPSNGDPRLLGRVDDIEARVRHLDAGLRAVARDGGLPIAPAQSLREGLEQVIEHFGAAGSIQLDFNYRDTEELIGPPGRIVAVRIVEEALRNVARHSAADKARVQVAAAESGLKIEVWDNGRGFDVSKVRRRAIRNGRLGLRSMEQRAQLVGGTLELFSSGRGHTRVILTLPAADRRVEAADQPTVAQD